MSAENFTNLGKDMDIQVKGLLVDLTKNSFLQGILYLYYQKYQRAF